MKARNVFLSLIRILILIFPLVALCQTGDLIKNPFKDKTAYQLKNIFDGATFDSAGNLIMVGFGDVTTPPEETEIAIPAGSSVGTGTSESGNVDGNVQLGVQLSKIGSFYGKFIFNIADRQDLVEGNSINNYFLNPSISSLGFNFDLAKWFKLSNEKDFIRIGAYARGGVASSSYLNQDQSTRIAGSMQYWSLGLSFISKPIRVKLGKEEDNVFQIGIDLGFTGRSLIGDISQASQDDFREQILGFSNDSFNSFEWSFFLRLNNVRPYIKFTNFAFTNSQNNDVDILGLSGGRVFFGVDFLTSFFRDNI